MLVFAILMLGLGAIFAGFYYNQYAGSLTSLDGRLYAVTAALEFAVLVAGLFCMLLRVPAVVVWALVGTAILIAGDMGYSVDSALSADYVPPIIDALW
jgi:predicted benzoate:H+ symporter BenE